MTQLGLYDRPAPFVRASETSRDAAQSVDGKTLRAIVLAFIRGRNGATCDDVEASLGLRHQTASARIRELVLGGHLIDSGKTNTTRSGRKATVWRAKEIAL